VLISHLSTNERSRILHHRQEKVLQPISNIVRAWRDPRDSVSKIHPAVFFSAIQAIEWTKGGYTSPYVATSGAKLT
jgi:hypothetical protein